MIDNKSLFTIGYGLYVLVARQGDKDNACIINVAQQVTSDPLQLMICVNKQNLTHDMVLRTLKFNLCPLSEEATMKPFQHFGFLSGRDVDKFAECTQELRTDNGLLYLPKFINAVISCVVTKSIDLGSHTMFIAMPMEARLLSDSPSITYAYYQQHIKPAVGTRAASLRDDGTRAASLRDDGTQAALPAYDGKKQWVCDVCGYIYEGDTLPADFICPWCKHPASDFKLVE